MLRTLNITLFLWLLSLKSFTQISSSLLIYTPFENHLVPYIETTLINFKYEKNKNIPLFNNISNLNQISSNITTEITLRETISYYTSIFYQKPKLNSIIDSSFINLLTTSDFLLVVNIGEVNNKIEYQFYLYNTSQLFGNFSYLEKGPINVQNVIIDINNTNFTDALDNALMLLFPDCNTNPQPKIYFEGQDCICDTLYVNTNCKYIFDGSYSFDKDTKKDFLEYKWEIYQNNSYVNTNVSLSDSQLIYECAAPDTSKIRLYVLDGTEDSSFTEVIVISYTPILVDILVDELNSIQFESLIKTNVSYNLFMFTNMFQRIDSTNFHISQYKTNADTIQHLKIQYYNRIKGNLFVQLNNQNTTKIAPGYYGLDYLSKVNFTNYYEGVTIRLEFDPQMSNTKYYIQLYEGNFKSNIDSIIFNNYLLPSGGFSISTGYNSNYVKTKSDTIKYSNYPFKFQLHAQVAPSFIMSWGGSLFNVGGNKIADSIPSLNTQMALGFYFDINKIKKTDLGLQGFRFLEGIEIGLDGASWEIENTQYDDIMLGLSTDFTIEYLFYKNFGIAPFLNFEGHTSLNNKNTQLNFFYYSYSLGLKFYLD